MLKLRKIIPPKPKPVYKANIHRTGKIGLAIDTASHFGITTAYSVELFVNEDENDDAIYARLRQAGAPDTYKVLKGGDYHSINAKAFFDEIKLNYSNGDIQLIAEDLEVEGEKYIKMEIVDKKSLKDPRAGMELFK